MIHAAGRLLLKLNLRALAKFLLLFALLEFLVAGIAGIVYRADATLLAELAFLGLGTAWLVARVPLPPWAAGVACGAIGVEATLSILGRLDVPFRALVESLSAILTGLRSGAAPVQPAADGLAAVSKLISGPVVEALRLKTWIAYLLHGLPSFDPAASAFLWSLTLFLMMAYAGWAVAAKNQPLAAVLPLALAVGGLMVYAGKDWSYILPVLAVILVLTAVAEDDAREGEWTRRGIGFASELRLDLALAVAPVVAGLVLAAGLIPAIQGEDFLRWVRDQFTNANGAGQNAAQSVGIPSGSGSGRAGSAPAGMPLNFLLSGEPSLTEQVMLVVITGENPIFVPGESIFLAPQHYWRAATYDRYNTRGWTSSPVTEEDFAAGEPVEPLLEGELLLHQSVTASRAGGGPIYLAGDILSSNEPFKLQLRGPGDYYDAENSVPEYEADSALPNPDEGELRKAGVDYPDWIRTRYLQIPQYVPQRVLSLARDLTASALTPYDQALAIEHYLRANYRYSLQINSPPPTQDVVDYFLFDSKTGYCDYFASAMTVLARAAGIPARLAVGYAPGTYDLYNHRYIVIGSDAHSWPELYFPNIGWVTFEPTATFSAIRRASSPVSLQPYLPGVGGQGAAQPDEAILHFENILPKIGIGLLAIAAALMLAALWMLSAPLRLFWQNPPDAVRSQYRALLAHGRRLRAPVRLSDTPLECTRRLADHCGDRLTAYEAEQIRRIGFAYSRMAYGGWTPATEERRKLLAGWPALDAKLWGLWWRRPGRGLSGPEVPRNQLAPFSRIDR